MASDLTLAEQRAREQIARTLHDGLQQMLVVAALNLDRMRPEMEVRGAAEPLAQARAQLDEAIEAARSLSFELFPPVLQDSGLPAALTWLGQWTQTKYGLEVRVTADPAANPTRSAELPSIEIFGLSMQPRTQDLHAIEQAGAAGYFMKGGDMQRLIDRLLMLHAVRRGGVAHK